MNIKKKYKHFIYTALIIFILIPFIRIVIDNFQQKKDHKDHRAFQTDPITTNEGEEKIEDDYRGITVTKYIESEPYICDFFGKSLSALEIYRYLKSEYNFSDFENILKYKEAEYVKYAGDDRDLRSGESIIPKDFSYVLNQLPNLKAVNIYDAGLINKTNMDYIKDLKTEYLFCKTNDKEVFSIFDSMKQLKKLTVESRFNDNDLDQILLENDTLEDIYFIYDKHFYRQFNIIGFELFKNNKEVIKINTPNLKKLVIDCNYKSSLTRESSVKQGVNFDIVFESDNMNLDSMSIIEAESINFPDIKNKIKVKELALENLNFDTLNVKESFKNVDLDSVKTLDIRNRYDNKVINLNTIAEFQNLEELYIKGISLTDISWIEQCKTLKKLSINLDYIQDLSFLKKLPNLKEVTPYGQKQFEESFLKELKELNITVKK